MKKLSLRTIFLIAAAGWIIYQVYSENYSDPFNEIVYRGEKVKLTKSYYSYEEYKEDANSIAPGEKARVERLVTESSIATNFHDRAAMTKSVFEHRFPGFGLISMGERPQTDGSTLCVFAVEIPAANKNRFFTFRGRNGAYTLIDDFVYSDDPRITTVSEAGVQLVYTFTDRTTLKHPSDKAPSIGITEDEKVRQASQGSFRVMAEYSSSGIWGNTEAGPFRHLMIPHKLINLPSDLSARFNKWIEMYENGLPQSQTEEFNKTGLQLARDLKKFLGPNASVEYQGETAQGMLAEPESVK